MTLKTYNPVIMIPKKAADKLAEALQDCIDTIIAIDCNTNGLTLDEVYSDPTILGWLNVLNEYNKAYNGDA